MSKLNQTQKTIVENLKDAISQGLGEENFDINEAISGCLEIIDYTKMLKAALLCDFARMQREIREAAQLEEDARQARLTRNFAAALGYSIVDAETRAVIAEVERKEL